MNYTTNILDHTAGESVATSTFSVSSSNIRGLHANLNQVHHHLFSAKPHVLFLTETQISNQLETTYLLCSGYHLYDSFHFKAGVCAHVNSDFPASRIQRLERSSSGFQ